jgi:hypothetical protein
VHVFASDLIEAAVTRGAWLLAIWTASPDFFPVLHSIPLYPINQSSDLQALPAILDPFISAPLVNHVIAAQSTFRGGKGCRSNY